MQIAGLTNSMKSCLCSQSCVILQQNYYSSTLSHKIDLSLKLLENGNYFWWKLQPRLQLSDSHLICPGASIYGFASNKLPASSFHLLNV